MPDVSRTGRIALAGTMAILLSGCGVTAISETERSICRELARDLPTYSREDTAETIAAGARFLDVFHAVCRG